MNSIHVLVVDDSSAYRNILKKAISSSGEYTVVAAMNLEHALRVAAREQPQLLVFELELPGTLPGQLLDQIKDVCPNIEVMVTSRESLRSSVEVRQLQRLGVCGFLGKPEGSNFHANSQELQLQFQEILKKVVFKRTATTPLPNLRAADRAIKTLYFEPIDPSKRRPFQLLPSTRFGIVVIGVSTGGPKALEELFKNFPRRLSMPMVIVQHMPERFTAKLAHSLDKLIDIPVIESSKGMVLQPNTVYIAKGGEHLILEKENGQLKFNANKAPPVQSCRPSIDVFFKSVSEAMESDNVLSLVLTGMGQDGADGVEYLKTKKCYSIAQNKESCVVYGMPKMIIERGLADREMDLKSISEFLKGLR